MHKITKTITILFLIFFVSQKIFADTYYVSTNGTHISPFSNWEYAATNIQDAVDVASSNDIVLVNDGTYYPTNQISVTNDITVKSVNGAENTIVDGSNTNRCFYINSGITIDGFTITNGNAFKWPRDSGGGVYCDAGGTVQNCTIIGNSAYDRGGGVNCNYGGIVQNCIISGNSTHFGGGVNCNNGTVQNCRIIGNSATYSGGGACGTGGTIQNCTIRRNIAIHEGGGGVSCGCVLKNCIISGNSSDHGGGVYCYGGGTVQNCTISGNSARLSGGLYCYDGGTVQNCIIYFNYAFGCPNYYVDSNYTFEYNCSIPLPNGEGNISDNPIFLDSGHIASDSPCVGAGNINFTSGSDIDGDSWENPPAIGCDQPVVCTCTGQLSVSVSAKYNKIATGYSNYFYSSIIGRASQNSWSFGDGKIWQNTLGGYYSWNISGIYKVILTAFNDTYPSGVSATVIVEVVEKQIHYVDINSTNPVSPYISWGTAATNIQAAVDVASAGEYVLINDGIYYLTDQIIVGNDIIVQSVNGNGKTFVDGNNKSRCFYLNDASIDGLAITNGMTYNEGGGVYLMGGMVQNCTVSGNSAFIGGGIYCSGGTVQNCTISRNLASHYFGGGVVCYEGGIVQNCYINENAAITDGGGLYCYGSQVKNCIIMGNSASRSAGGVLCNKGMIQNCTIVENSAIQYFGGGVVCYEGGTVINSILWNNSNANVLSSRSFNYYNCIENWENLVNGIITNKPEFIDAAAGDYRLKSFSPCINAGTNMSWMWTATDLDGNPRITDGTVDMGAYEYLPEPGIVWIVGLLATRYIMKRRKSA